MKVNPRRTLIFLPLAVLTIGFPIAKLEIYYRLTSAQQAATAAQMPTRAGLIQKVLTAPVPADAPTWKEKVRIINSAIDKVNINTRASVYRVVDGDLVMVADNANVAGVADRVSSAAVDRAIEILNPSNENNDSPQDGQIYSFGGERYHTQIKNFPITRGEPLAMVITTTNLDTSNSEATTIFVEASIWMTIGVLICTATATLINVVPIVAITRQLKRGESPKVPKWWPAQTADLANQINLDRSAIEVKAEALTEALARSEKLTNEIQTVNHIAVHDIKSDLTALLRGSEVIQETIEELIAFLGPGADPVVIDAIETIKFFSGLNINSSNNAFEVLDQRNKLYDLESKIEIVPCSVSDILSALEAAFSGQAGEFRLHNDCPHNRSIVADYSLLLGVLKNIVRNGFIHNDSALKRVEVRVGPIGHRSRITITDNGVGMPAAYLQEWGRTMGKVAQLNSKRGGSGTGLYSIRAIMNAHKGASIDIKSVVGQGTVYVLEFNHVS
jgi:signal transduction histidine kinase